MINLFKILPKHFAVMLSVFFALSFFGIKELGYWLSAPAELPVSADIIVALGGDEGDRVKMAAKLYKKGYAKKILLTGMADDFKIVQHQNWRIKYLLDQQIPEEALIYDRVSTNTHQEVSNLAVLLKMHSWGNALIISDPPHMRRLSFCLNPLFKEQGLNYKLIQTEPDNWQSNYWWRNANWKIFCLLEVVKILYYTLAYNDFRLNIVHAVINI